MLRYLRPKVSGIKLTKRKPQDIENDQELSKLIEEFQNEHRTLQPTDKKFAEKQNLLIDKFLVSAVRFIASRKI